MDEAHDGEYGIELALKPRPDVILAVNQPGAWRGLPSGYGDGTCNCLTTARARLRSHGAIRLRHRAPKMKRTQILQIHRPAPQLLRHSSLRFDAQTPFHRGVEGGLFRKPLQPFASRQLAHRHRFPLPLLQKLRQSREVRFANAESELAHAGPGGSTQPSERITGTRPIFIVSKSRMLETLNPRGHKTNLLAFVMSAYRR